MSLSLIDLLLFISPVDLGLFMPTGKIQEKTSYEKSTWVLGKNKDYLRRDNKANKKCTNTFLYKMYSQTIGIVICFSCPDAYI